MKIVTEGSKELLMAWIQCARDVGFALQDQITEAIDRKKACCGGAYALPYFWGKVDEEYRPDAETLVPLYGVRVDLFSDHNIIIDFNSSDSEWIFLAVPYDKPVKSNWAGTDPLNHGLIQGPISIGGGLFPYPDVVIVNIAEIVDAPYRIYLSNYASAAGFITFKN
jgi:hypothetical protein